MKLLQILKFLILLPLDTAILFLSFLRQPFAANTLMLHYNDSPACKIQASLNELMQSNLIRQEFLYEYMKLSSSKEYTDPILNKTSNSRHQAMLIVQNTYLKMLDPRTTPPVKIEQSLINFKYALLISVGTVTFLLEKEGYYKMDESEEILDKAKTLYQVNEVFHRKAQEHRRA